VVLFAETDVNALARVAEHGGPRLTGAEAVQAFGVYLFASLHFVRMSDDLQSNILNPTHPIQRLEAPTFTDTITIVHALIHVHPVSVSFKMQHVSPLQENSAYPTSVHLQANPAGFSHASLPPGAQVPDQELEDISNGPETHQDVQNLSNRRVKRIRPLIPPQILQEDLPMYVIWCS
jgi:hypothetical protein